MSGRWLGALGAVLAILAGAPTGAHAQTESDDPLVEASGVEPARLVEDYLTRRGIRTVLADHLADQVKRSLPERRRELAERLARVYVQLLTDEADQERRERWEDRSRELLSLVPEADSFELRINLSKALYVRAEEIVERSRLRLASPDELAEAERLLRAIKDDLGQVASRVHRRVETLEKAEESGKDSGSLSEEIGEARRLRSLAFYYSGWTDYYLAHLLGGDKLATDAMRSFGWLLNARGGAPATLEKLPEGLLKYEHIARAAIGCGLCAALKGNDVEAGRWLDAVEQTADLSPSVREQLLPRRIAVLAGAQRWGDLERLIRVHRHSDRTGGGPQVEPLGVVPARLLAVVTLEDKKLADPETVDFLGRIALGDLVATNQIKHVLDLAKRYGTAPIGEVGFIPHFVRALQVYERAREAHTASGSDIDEPAGSPEVVNLYDEATRLFEASLSQADANTYGAERARASMLVGLSNYYGGKLVPAADHFLEVVKVSTSSKESEEALWLAVLSLDRAVRSGETSAQQRRDEAAALFLQSHAGSERAVQLLVGLGTDKLLDPESAVRILLAVDQSSPAHEAARRQASRLLYSIYRGSRGADRDFAAQRFVAVGEQVLTIDKRGVLDPDPAKAREAGDRIVQRVRQLLDAMLGMSVPDYSRAQSALGTLDEVSAKTGVDLAAFRAELLYRRLQVAVAQDDQPQIGVIAEQLASEMGPYSDAADRLLYRRAVEAWQQDEAASASGLLESVVLHGKRIIDHGGGAGRVAGDAGLLSVYATVAKAAFALWDGGGGEGRGDPRWRDLVIQLDEAVLQAQPRTEASLRRVARTKLDAGDKQGALDAWLTVLAGMQTGADRWFEARYHSIRVLSEIDPAKARDAMNQHKAVYPEFGPEPWGTQLRELDGVLPGGFPIQPGGENGGGR